MPPIRKTVPRKTLVTKVEKPREEPLQLAIQAWRGASGKQSISACARFYGVSKTTMLARMEGRQDILTFNHKKQSLLPEEHSLVVWVSQLAAWGWPPKVARLRRMALVLLRRRIPNGDLGTGWVSRFLQRNKSLKSTWISARDRQ